MQRGRRKQQWYVHEIPISKAEETFSIVFDRRLKESQRFYKSIFLGGSINQFSLGDSINQLLGGGSINQIFFGCFKTIM